MVIRRLLATAWAAGAVSAVVACTGPQVELAEVVADTHRAGGDAYYQRGQFDSARIAWRLALDKPDIVGTAEEAWLRTSLGLASYRLGEYAESRQEGEAGLHLARTLGSVADIARAENALGLLSWSEGRLGEAAEHLAVALEGFASLRDTDGIARASNNLGLVRFELGRFEEARAAFLLARDSARVAGNRRVEARALSNLGMWEIWAGDPTRALALLAEARDRGAAADDVVSIASALGQAGSAYAVLGQPGRAIATLDSALAVARDAGMRDEEANDLVVIAGVYADAGDADQALRAYAQARQINEELGLTIEAGTVLREEAQLRAARGALEVAHRDARAALALHRHAQSRRDELLDLLVLAEVERRLGRTQVSTERLRDARILAAALGSAQARVSTAIAEARLADDRRDPARTLRVLDAVHAELDRGGAAAEAEAHALRLRAWAALGQLDSAVASGRRAVEAIERVRSGFAFGPHRTAYASERGRVHADLIAVLLRRGAVDEAFAVADAARGRAIREQIGHVDSSAAGGTVMTGLAESERLLRRIDHLMARLEDADIRSDEDHNELRERLQEARLAYRDWRARAAESDPARAALVGSHTTDANAVRAALAADEALLEFLVTPDTLYTFVVTVGGLDVVTQRVGREALVHQVQLARDLLMEREPPGRAAAVTEALYDRLIEPVRATGALTGIHRLVIVPHGALSYLPFAPLRDPASGRTLAQDYALAFLPSAGALPALRARAMMRAGNGARASGFAPFPDRLPASRVELQSFRRALPSATVSYGQRATEDAVRQALARGRIVHVATHGIMNARNPLFSRLELAPGRRTPSGTPRDRRNDGRLEVHELLDLHIASPLIFLSGCETALGGAWATAFEQGEDYATLGQVFLLAGADGVIATLWRIDDDGAAAFADRFYRHLRSLPAAEALAAAQGDLMADPRWRSPYYWAAYTYSGVDPGRPAQNTQRVSVAH